jgi:ribose-phosphate pyrophosphokinase
MPNNNILNPSTIRFKILPGKRMRDLTNSICDLLDEDPGKIEYKEFSDGECIPRIKESIRDEQIFIISSTCQPVSNVFELILTINAVRRASAHEIIVVIPYYGYARQDRKDEVRTTIPPRDIADMITAAGANRIISIDLHVGQIEGFFTIPVEHIHGHTIFAPYLKSIELDNLTFCSPDVGGTKRTKAFRKYFPEAPMVIIDKDRPRENEIGSMELIGSVKDQNIIIVDDIVDTAGTLCKAADVLLQHGAKSVRAIITHPVLSGNAYENINNSNLTELIVSDTIPLKYALGDDRVKKIKVISAAPILSDVIGRVLKSESVSMVG